MGLMKKPGTAPPAPAPKSASSEVIHTGRAVGPEQKLGAVQAEAKPYVPQPIVITPTPVQAAKPSQPAQTAPTAQPAQPNPSPKDRGRAAAYGVVSTVLERVAQEAQRRGGSLNADDIRALAGGMAQQTETLAGALNQSFEAYAREKEIAVLQKIRQRHFERLMVKRFSHLFSDEDAAPDENDGGGLSRRVVPAFNQALSVFMGPDEYEHMQDRAAALVETAKTGAADNEFHWDAVYKQPEAPQLVLDALMVIAGNFQDTERRVKWFTEYIDKNMAPSDAMPGQTPEDAVGADAGAAGGAEAGTEAAVAAFAAGGLAPPGGPERHFDDENARKMLKSLFSMLWGALGDQQGRDQLTQRHGPEKVAAAAKVVNVFC